MESIKKHKCLTDIPSLDFEGYIWLSDSKEPKVLRSEKYDFSSVEQNPFIVEGLLYNESSKTSIHIQHAGEYQIFEYDLRTLSQIGQLEEVSFLPHRLAGVEKVNFKQVWIPESDENCIGMEVLKMKLLVFCGFKR